LKYQYTEAFTADLADLSKKSPEHLKLVFATLPKFIEAAERYVSDPGTAWPAGLRVGHLEGHSSVWEMTWNFAGPDLRSTFEWVEIDGEPAVRWRRIGRHAIYKNP